MKRLALALALCGCSRPQEASPQDAQPPAPVVSSAPVVKEEPPAPKPTPPSPEERLLIDAGADLIIRGGPGRPGWWVGTKAPPNPCIPASLYTSTGGTLYVCGPQGWKPQ